MALVSVIAVGSALHTDDGLGSRLLEDLGKMDLPEGVSLVDAGLALSTVLISQSDADQILILDAARAGGRPGDVYILDFDGIGPGGEAKPGYRSVHHLGVADSIAMARLCWRGSPGITIAGIEPASIELGVGLSSPIASRLPEITALIAGEIRKLARSRGNGGPGG